MDGGWLRWLENYENVSLPPVRGEFLVIIGVEYFACCPRINRYLCNLRSSVAGNRNNII